MKKNIEDIKFAKKENIAVSPELMARMNILIPNMFYRTDIGEKWPQDSDRLQTWGYLW